MSGPVSKAGEGEDPIELLAREPAFRWMREAAAGEIDTEEAIRELACAVIALRAEVARLRSLAGPREGIFG